MASNKSKSLLNVRDSLQNFYNLNRLTQQSTVLEEISAIEQDNDESNQQQNVETLKINDDKNGNQSDLEIQSNIQPLIQKSNIQPLEFSEHESDDDIVQEMDITPGNIETLKKPTAIKESETIAQQSQVSIQPNLEIEGVQQIPDTFLFEIPTFEDAEEADKKIENTFKKTSPFKGKTNIDLAKLSNLTTACDHDEEDEKLMEISDPSKMSKTLAEVNANQNMQKSTSLIGENQSEEELKPKRPRKRKLDDADFAKQHENIPLRKKRRLSAKSLEENVVDIDKDESEEEEEEEEHDPYQISIDRSIGLNEGQIENSLQKLHNMENKIVEENILLNSYQSLAIRNSEHVTPTMVAECRQLLDLFGIPYITAPSEAEAQCAELNKLGLVDGIITDDSDVFLFGGKIIYKNLFHLNKYVEKYTNTLIKSKLGLTQNKLISLAMLLGSDYTDGVKGIGPVNGIEIIQTFCSEKESDFNGLKEFKNWIYSTERDKFPKKKPDLKIQRYDEYMILKKGWFKYKHRNLKKNWFVDLHTFPEANVIETYLKPEVDSSDVSFKWGKPDINKLKIICSEKFGWDQRTIDSTLNPINKIVINGRGAVQSSIFSFADVIAPNKKPKSVRIQRAVKALIEEIKLKKQIDAQRQHH